jgi:serine/threonine protein kinase
MTSLGNAGGIKNSGDDDDSESDDEFGSDSEDEGDEEKKMDVCDGAVASSSSQQQTTTTTQKSSSTSVADSMKRSWKFLHEQYPHASFLSEGAFKQVYRVFNSNTNSQEALSVMDLDLIASTGNSQVVGAELAVSVLLSSLVRLGSCPNFISTRRAFTCDYAPPASHWGDEHNKCPKGKVFSSRGRNPMPRQPNNKKGKFQYISMELCKHGDIESYLARQVGKVVSGDEARSMLFQMAFSLFSSKAKFGLKHYDIKNLNFLLQDANDTAAGEGEHTHVSLRYGYKGNVFDVKMERERAVVAKLADYGTADLRPDTENMPISMANFTTLENTPPEFLVLGEKCCQGWGHDNWGLGLSFFHLMTGNCPYEELLEDVVCPPGLKRKLSQVWDNGDTNFALLESLINAEVYDEGDEKDYTLFDTLYRYLVLFGAWRESGDDAAKKKKFGGKDGKRVWDAIDAGLRLDAAAYAEDCGKFALETGQNYILGGCRERLAEVKGAMECLKGLLAWDPAERWTAEAVLDSDMMAELIMAGGGKGGGGRLQRRRR